MLDSLKNDRAFDLNADIGDGFEGENSAHDERVIKRLTSANIACGFHGGDPAVMKRSVDFALKYKVAIGAHLGLPNVMGLALNPGKVSAKKAYAQVLYQLGALNAFVVAQDAQIQHVKLQGALYEMSRSDRELSDAIVDAVVRFDKKLIVLGPAQSELLFAAQDAGLNAAVELPITSVDELSEDSSLGSGYASLSVDAAEPYAVQLLDEIRRDMHKKGLKLAPLRDLHLG